MAIPRRALILLAALLIALPFPGCKKNEDGDDEFDLPTSEELNIQISQTFFEFTHTVGQSPCPQLVGRLTVRNTGTSPFTTDVKARGTVPLTFSPNRTVGPGESVIIDIFFNCTSQQNFLVTVDTLSANDRQQASDALPPGSFNVSGIIRRP